MIEYRDTSFGCDVPEIFGLYLAIRLGGLIIPQEMAHFRSPKLCDCGVRRQRPESLILQSSSSLEGGKLGLFEGAIDERDMLYILGRSRYTSVMLGRWCRLNKVKLAACCAPHFPSNCPFKGSTTKFRKSKRNL